MRLNNPALARFAARDPPAIPLGPLMRSQPQIAAMTAPSFGGQERMANYPSILSPSLHSQSQPLSGYPVANMPSSNSPMVPPYFSAAAVPMKFSNAVPNAPVYAQQTPGISRQGNKIQPFINALIIRKMLSTLGGGTLISWRVNDRRKFSKIYPCLKDTTEGGCRNVRFYSLSRHY